MDKDSIINTLREFQDKLSCDVCAAYKQKKCYGEERFESWKNKFVKYLESTLPGESEKFIKRITHNRRRFALGESYLSEFNQNYSEPSAAYIDSLVLDITNDEYEFDFSSVSDIVPKRNVEHKSSNNKIFIVHGHDELYENKTARFIGQLGFEPVILHEQASQGLTVIEKIEKHTEVGYAIVLYTADDKGNENGKADSGTLNPRARQNVIFEHGYLIAKLGRNRVVPLVTDESIELPSDIKGIVYISDTNWKIAIAIEMKAAGYNVDLNKIT